MKSIDVINRKKNKHFIFMWGNGQSYHEYMCSDIFGLSDVRFYNRNTTLTWRDRLIALQRKLHSKNAGSVVFLIRIKKELGLKKNVVNYIIFSEDYINSIYWDYYDLLKNEYKICDILYIDDPIGLRMGEDRLGFFKSKMDVIISTDKADAIRYGVPFFPLIYSKPLMTAPLPLRYDLFFVGRGKKRIKTIQQIKRNLKTRNATSYISLNINNKKEDWIEYSEVINYVRSSNCLLEILQEGQTGITLRTMEAVLYNKKLLTNNSDIVNYPFYDKRFISVFNSVDDIDYDFIMSVENVQYNYHGEYSPIELINLITSIFDGGGGYL